MENKINVAELLKDCPKGMELDCALYDGVEFMEVDEESDTIILRVRNKFIRRLNKYGQDDDHIFSKCLIFPKGKTTWEGFIPPCKFKKGDVLVSETGNIVLLSHIDSKDRVNYHCIIPTYGSFRIEENTSIGVGKYYDCVLANEQQRQRMYDKIKSSGYKYNQNTNKLEKLIEPKFNNSEKVDNVNHPPHYTWLKEKCGIEVIDITRHLDFDCGNVVKYTLRHGHKDEEGMTNLEKAIEDLKKAKWYLEDKIKMLEEKI